MLFSSILFVFCFLPLVLVAYFLLPRRFRNSILLVLSLFFYAWGEGGYVLLLVLSSLVDHLSGKRIHEATDPAERWRWLRVSLIFNLGMLAAFKYMGFLARSLNAVMASLSLGVVFPVIDLPLPLGISFYSFQSMSYSLDIYRRKVTPTESFSDFACYVALFPQLVAGPIVRYQDIAQQLRERRETLPLFVSGVERFLVGLAKKILLANAFAAPADLIFGLPVEQLSAPIAWSGAILYTGQIYFDFSGYSDMAIGLGRMFGFEFQENFTYPYVAQSIRDFWRRWHISLSTWFRDYLYLPLGGSQQGNVRTYRNLMTVFLLCGLWHGAAWTFVLWGIFHGAFLILERLGLGTLLARAPRPLRHFYTLFLVVLGWVLFRAQSLSQAWCFYRAMSGVAAAPTEAAWSFQQNPLVLVVAVLGACPFLPAFRTWVASLTSARIRSLVEILEALALLGTYLLTLAVLAGATHNPFIYYHF